MDMQFLLDSASLPSLFIAFVLLTGIAWVAADLRLGEDFQEREEEREERRVRDQRKAIASHHSPEKGVNPFIARIMQSRAEDSAK